ncbi:MAG: DUF935 domain-containing protein [Alphaproteobacteria bacterium]|nr:DUF935 domain-containing protein [Alphaproteobacteria bacterium]
MAEDVTQDAPAKKPEMREIATSGDGRDITIGYFGQGVRQMTDPILLARGSDLDVYEEILRDDQVQSCFQQRRLAVIKAEWDVEAGGDDKASQMAAEFMREQLDAIRFDDTTLKMLKGLFLGYSVAECIWGKDGRHFTLDALKVRRAKRFRFDMDGGLRLLTLHNSAEGELMPARKFWTFTAGADDDDDPYGRGLGYWCFWPVWFKKNNVKFWTLYQDKFSGPTSVGKYPPNATKEEIAKLLQAAGAVGRDSSIAIPEGMVIELLEAVRASSASYEPFYDRMDGAIAKVILSQTMTTDAKATGIGSGAANVHMDVREEVTASDADLICSSFNETVVAWLTAWNFPGATPPRVWRQTEPPEDLNSVAERDNKVKQLGFRPTPERITDTYGEGWEPDTPPAPPPGSKVLPGLPGGDPLNPEKTPPAASFAEAVEDDVARLGRELDDASAAAMGVTIDAIKAELDASSTLVEFSERLMRRYPSLDVEDFAAAMRDGMVLAELTGRDDIAG